MIDTQILYFLDFSSTLNSYTNFQEKKSYITATYSYLL